MTLLAEIWNMLTPWQRRGILAMQAVSLVMAVSTAAGITAIAPFFAVLGDPQLIEHHWITLRRLRGRYTVVLIAHGMSAARACDLIFHLEQGKIVGSRTHEGLLKSSAVFRRMAGVG
jgi:hypothetical protein